MMHCFSVKINKCNIKNNYTINMSKTVLFIIIFFCKLWMIDDADGCSCGGGDDDYLFNDWLTWLNGSISLLSVRLFLFCQPSDYLQFNFLAEKLLSSSIRWIEPFKMVGFFERQFHCSNRKNNGQNGELFSICVICSNIIVKLEMESNSQFECSNREYRWSFFV